MDTSPSLRSRCPGRLLLRLTGCLLGLSLAFGTAPARAANKALDEFVKGIRAAGYLPLSSRQDGFVAGLGWEIGRWVVLPRLNDPDLSALQPDGQRYDLGLWPVTSTNSVAKGVQSAWREFSIGGEWSFGQLCRAMQALDASVQWESSKAWVLDWGQVREEFLDPHELSAVLLCSFFPTLTNVARLDPATADRLLPVAGNRKPGPNQPWVITKRLCASDLRVDFSKVSGFAFKASAATPAYGRGGLNLRSAGGRDTEFLLDAPMTLGFGAARLLEMKPLPPRLLTTNVQDWQRLLDYELQRSYSFTWEVAECVRGSLEVRTVTVPDVRLARQLVYAAVRAQDAAGGSRVAERAAQEAREVVQDGTPVELAVDVEASPLDQSTWKSIFARPQPGTVATNEGVRLRVFLAEPAYVYVLNRDGHDRFQVLHPQVAGEEASLGDVKPWPAGWSTFPAVCDVKDDDGQIIDFYPFEEPGTESLQVIASRTPLPDLPARLAALCQTARQAVDANPAAVGDAAGILGDTPKLCRPPRASARFRELASGPPPPPHVLLEQAAAGATTRTVGFTVRGPARAPSAR